MNLLFRILCFAIIAILLDIPWLLGTSTWVEEIVLSIQGSPMEFSFPPAIIVYLAVGYLATLPTSPLQAFCVGTAVYAVYDYTNVATLKNYSHRFALADTLWGGTLFTAVHLIARNLLSS